MGGWVELSLRIAAVDYAAVEALLEAAGALSLAQADGDSEVFGEPGLEPAPGWNRYTLTALFDAAIDTDAIEQALRARLGADLVIARKAIADQPWHEQWKQRWAPVMYHGGLCVCPTWCESPPDARTVLRLDPGGAFGTGAHETTALCLDWLAEAQPLAALRVLDYGCGSGILAIAAVLLGAAAVDAIDIDVDALEVARANAHLNRCAGRIAFGTPETARDGYDVVVANILLAPLLTLAPCLAHALRPGGRLVLSGLLAPQFAQVSAAYAPWIAFAPPVLRGEWARLDGTRLPP